MRFAGITIDAADPLALADFYERLLGWPVIRIEGPRAGKPPTDGWAILRSLDSQHKIEVQWEPNYQPPAWPSEPDAQLMMMHFDLGVTDLDAAVRWAVDCGATVAGVQPQDGVRVLIDPEGHPFCFFLDGETTTT